MRPAMDDFIAGSKMSMPMGIALALLLLQGAQAGSEAPDFKLRDQDNKEWHLGSLRGRGWVLVAYFPKAATPG